MTRLLVSYVVIAFASSGLGCKGGEDAAQPLNVVEALPADPAEGAAQAVAEDEAVDRKTPTPAEVEPVEQTARPVPEPSNPPRDLGDELRMAVGSPADCLQDYRPSAPTTIRVNINAIVRPTGMIIEPSASGRGLSANDRRCIEERVGDVTLEPLGGESSAPVSTHVDIRYRPPAIEEADVGGPAPELKDVVEPLPKKTPIAPSGVPIEGPSADPIEGPAGVPIEGPKGVRIEGPKPKPIEGYQVDEGAERWTD